MMEPSKILAAAATASILVPAKMFARKWRKKEKKTPKKERPSYISKVKSGIVRIERAVARALHHVFKIATLVGGEASLAYAHIISPQKHRQQKRLEAEKKNKKENGENEEEEGEGSKRDSKPRRRTR